MCIGAGRPKAEKETLQALTLKKLNERGMKVPTDQADAVLARRFPSKYGSPKQATSGTYRSGVSISHM